MKIIIDNGHGVNTAGKCSPDRSLREWSWNREIAMRVYAMLCARELDVVLLTREDTDVPVRERVRRVNALCRNEACLLISIHVNASGSDDKWHSAKGWSVYVGPNASNASKELARCLNMHAKAYNCDIRQPKPNQPYWVKNLAICRDTICPAVLTENMFMDNRSDCEWLRTEKGKDTIAKIHAFAILDFLETYNY